MTNTIIDTIKGSEFNGAYTFISLYNSDKCLALNNKYLLDNTFYGSVLLRNTFRSYVSGNTFDDENSGFLLSVSNSVHPNDPSGCQEEIEDDPFSLNIVNNHFTGSVYQLWLNCLASDLTPFYIAGNFFHSSGTAFKVGLQTNKICGDFKSNIFTSDQYDRSATLYQSDMNFFGNTLLSDWGINVNIYSSSSVNSEPLELDDNYYWYGGSNQLETDYPENVEFDAGSDLFIDYGYNCFEVYWRL